MSLFCRRCRRRPRLFCLRFLVGFFPLGRGIRHHAPAVLVAESWLLYDWGTSGCEKPNKREISLHLQVRAQFQLLRLRLHWSKWCFRFRDESWTFWSWIRLPFTQKTWIWNQNFLVSSWVRKLLNPELKVETLYPDTFESEFPCSVNALRIWIPWTWWIWKHSWIRKPLL